MGLMDKLRSLVSGHDLPAETRSLFEKAGSAEEVLFKLDSHLTRNQVEFKKLEKQLSRLEALEQGEIEKVKLGVVTGRQKDNALMTIRRLRQQLDSCLARQRIFDKNMILHINLINRIRDVQAMQMAGVTEEEIDGIIYEFDENWEQYSTTLAAGRVVAQPQVMERSIKQDAELKALEAEILGLEPEPAEVEPVGEGAQPEEADIEEPEAPRRPAIEEVLDDGYFEELESVRSAEDMRRLERAQEREDQELAQLEREILEDRRSQTTKPEERQLELE